LYDVAEIPVIMKVGKAGPAAAGFVMSLVLACVLLWVRRRLLKNSL